MKRLIVSAAYTALAFLTTFVVIVLIVRSSTRLEQAQFFYFQSLYYVFSTVISQSLTLSTFRNLPVRRAGFTADALSVVGMVLLLAFAATLQFEWTEIAAFALATVLLYRGSVLTITLQYRTRNAPLWLLVPIISMALCIAAAYAVRTAGPAAMFLANGVFSILVPYTALQVVKSDGGDAPNKPDDGPKSTSIFVFFLIGAMTFQWERLLYGAQGNTDGLLVTGYVMTVVLPPLSMLFATVYRANAREIFNQEGQVARRFWRTGGVFLALSMLYLLAIFAIWPQIMALLAADVVPSPMLALVLGAAIILDRLGNLAVFTRSGKGAYGFSAGLKLCLLAGATLLAVLLAADGPNVTYAIFLGASLLYAAGVTLRRP